MSRHDTYTDLNARGRMMQARRNTADTETWRLIDIMPALGLRFRRATSRR